MSKYALLVGISRYQDEEIPDLLYAHRDAEVLGRHLEQECGFDVRVLQCTKGSDAITNGVIARELDRIADDIAEDDTFFFFFSGHGVQKSGRPILLTSDTAVRAPRLALPVENLMEVLDDVHCRNRVLVFDCCRSDSTLRRGEGRPLLAESFVRDVKTRASSGKARAKTTGLMFSCSADQCAYEWPARKHGVFTHYLLEGLKEKAWEGNQLIFQKLASYVSKQVAEWSKRRPEPQVPWIDYSGTGEPIVIAEGSGPKKTGIEESEVEDFVASLHDETDLSGSSQQFEPSLTAEERELRDRAEFLLGKEDYYSTIGLLIDQVNSPNPDWAKEASHLLASAYFAEKDYSTALLHYSRVIELGGKDPDVWAKRARCFFEGGDVPHCISDLKVAVALSPDEVPYREFLGRVLSQEKQHSQVIDVLCPGGKLSTQNNDRLQELATAHYEEGEFLEALELLKKVIPSKPADASLLSLRSQTYLRLGNVRLALEDLEKAHRLEPDNKAYASRLKEVGKKVTDLAAQQGRKFFRQRSWREAVEAYRGAPELRLLGSDAQLNLGQCLYRIGEKTEGLLHLSRAATRDPSGDGHWNLFGRANVYKELGEVELAIKDFEEIDRIQTSPDILCSLIGLHSELRNHEKVGLYSRRCSQKFSSAPFSKEEQFMIAHSRGCSHFNNGEYITAIEPLSRAYTIDQQGEPELFSNMKQAYLMLLRTHIAFFFALWLPLPIIIGLVVFAEEGTSVSTSFVIVFYVMALFAAFCSWLNTYHECIGKRENVGHRVWRRLSLYLFLLPFVGLVGSYLATKVVGGSWLSAGVLPAVFLLTCIFVCCYNQAVLKSWEK